MPKPSSLLPGYTPMSTPLAHRSRQEILDLPRFHRTTFVNGLSGFKSVALCGTTSPDGLTNLSIISSIVHVGANPPYMGMVIRPHTVPRHTLENLLATGEFTLNHIREDFYQAAHQTAARYEQSEFEGAGLTEWYSETLKAPYVAESHIRIGLKYVERHDMLNGTIFVVGAVEEVWYPEAALQADGYLDLQAAGTVTVATLDAYHRTEKIGRMAYAKPDLPPREIGWDGTKKEAGK